MSGFRGHDNSEIDKSAIRGPADVEVLGRREHNSKPWRGNAATNRLGKR
jgi:hypothetical protein